jgi:hypothetical protein
MAVMVPDRLPTNTTRGEERVFAVLRKLPDECLVYYEPVIGVRYPDFVVIDPTLGVLVIEVKGWYPTDILGADTHEVSIIDRRSGGVVTKERHPLRQAREYMHCLQDECRANRLARRLLVRRTGPRTGRFVFPFGHFAVLSNIDSRQLARHKSGDLTPIFPPGRVVPRDELDRWETLSGYEVKQELARFFNPAWPFPGLSPEQVDGVRAIVHPEVSLPVPRHAERLAVLDLRQERQVWRIGDGHRIVYGIAGGGKTVLLLARAKAVARQRGDAEVLVLCFNVTLAAHLRASLADYPAVRVHHFDGWAGMNGRRRHFGVNGEAEDDEVLGRRLLDHLRGGASDSRRFDVVLVDEAQDWPPSWFECVLAAMKDPWDGDLMIVGDRQQGLRRTAAFTWSSVGVSARGRTLSAALDLDRNYRNTREILELAACFANDQPAGVSEDQFGVIAVNPARAIRSTGVRPILLRARTRRDECETAVEVVRRLLGRDGRLLTDLDEPLQPHEVGILYPRLFGSMGRAMLEFLDLLAAVAPVVWLREGDRGRVHDPGVKVQTIQSARGLQYPAVILLWADLLPGQLSCLSPEDEARLMYVALTRPENHLFVTHSGPSPFVDQMLQSGLVRTRLPDGPAYRPGPTP